MKLTKTVLSILAVIILLSAISCKIDEPSINAGEFPFVNEGKTWNCENRIYKMNGDTIIGAKSYKKVYKKCLNDYNDNVWHYFAAIRERDKQVYAIKHHKNKEVLIYDFSIDVGDIFTCRIDNDGVVLHKVYAKTRLSDGRTKFIMTISYYGIMPTRFCYWIEGIGDITEGTFMYIEDSFNNLWSCEENNKTIYPQNETY